MSRSVDGFSRAIHAQAPTATSSTAPTTPAITIDMLHGDRFAPAAQFPFAACRRAGCAGGSGRSAEDRASAPSRQTFVSHVAQYSASTRFGCASRAPIEAPVRSAGVSVEQIERLVAYNLLQHLVKRASIAQ